jgi:hypothetical protein
MNPNNLETKKNSDKKERKSIEMGDVRSRDQRLQEGTWRKKNSDETNYGFHFIL